MRTLSIRTIEMRLSKGASNGNMNRDEFYIALEANRAYVQEHSDELKHWGIKGQKWGLRRFQNPDGTLTEEGKRHYGRIGEIGKGLGVKSTINSMEQITSERAEIGNSLREKGKHAQARQYITTALADAKSKDYYDADAKVKSAKDVQKASLKGGIPNALLSTGGMFGGLALANTGHLGAGIATVIAGLGLGSVLGNVVSSKSLDKAQPGARERYNELLNKYGNMTTEQLYNEFDKTFVKSMKAPKYNSKEAGNK